MKNKSLYFLLFLLLGTAGAFLFAPEARAEISDSSGTGRSALTIVPLDEDVPRIYEINDLYFGTHQDTETNKKHQAENDLTIRILDARKNPTDWELQLQIESFKEDGSKLKAATLNLGKGTFETVSPDAAAGLAGQEYQTDFDTGEYKTVITSAGQKNRGWVVYHIPKENISLAYGKGNPVGNYQTTSHWRLINANLT